MWVFYNIFFPVVFLFMTPYFLFRMCRRGGYGEGFLQRFGVYGGALRDKMKSRDRVWIHAVSVGEIFVALRFMEELRAHSRDAAFVLTTTTSTGRAVAARKLGESDILLYFPVDLPFIMKSVLDSLNPRALVMVESELWPNLIRAASARRIPVMLLNGRLSERSYRGYSKLKPLVRDVLRCFSLFCVQDWMNAGRLEKLGADPDRIKVVGSAKYDIVHNETDELAEAGNELLKQTFGAGVKTLVGGSTWPGEEKVLLDIYKRLRDKYDDLRLVLVPRHAERAGQVLAQIEKAGFSAARRNGSPLPPGSDAGSDVLLVDTTGELKMFYASADVIFVGKSLTAHGGQNIIEPAMFEKPVLIGPNMENFATVASDFLAADAIIQVEDYRGLEEKIVELWSNAEMRAEYGRRARRLVFDKAGAVRTSATHFMNLIQGDI